MHQAGAGMGDEEPQPRLSVRNVGVGEYEGWEGRSRSCVFVMMCKRPVGCGGRGGCDKHGRQRRPLQARGRAEAEASYRGPVDVWTYGVSSVRRQTVRMTRMHTLCFVCACPSPEIFVRSRFTTKNGALADRQQHPLAQD